MRRLDTHEIASGGAIQFLGAPDLDLNDEGISPRRLPAWTRPQIPDPFMDAMVAMGSGVRMRFRTDSDELQIDAAVTCVRYVGEATPAQVIQLVDCSDGRSPIDATAVTPSVFVLDPANPADIGFEVGGTDTFRFSGLGDGWKTCEVWLPHGGTIRIKEMRLTADAAIEPAGPTGKPRWIHYGSSISHCLEATVPTGIWPAVAARLADVELRNLGMGGQCMLDPFVARVIRDEPADAISLKLGINIVNGDTMRERVFVPAVHGFLDTVREGHPDTPLLVVSPIFCPSAEHAPGPTIKVGPVFVTLDGHQEIRQGCLTLVRIRQLLAEIVERRRQLGDANLHHLDGLELFGEADASDLPDALHPNPAGYRRMGERFAAIAFGASGVLRVTAPS